MNAPLAPTFRLLPRGGAGLACDDDGVSLGPVRLVEASRDAEGKLWFRSRPAAEIGKALRLAYGAAAEDVVARRHRSLAHIAQLLADGEGARARMHAVLLRFPDIDDEGMAKLTRAATLGKFNPDWANEDRVLNGQPGAEEWTSGGGGGAVTKPKKASPEDIPAKKDHFVAEHLADAQKAAEQLHVPVENILGLSALESSWGRSPIAVRNRNFFGIHYPAPFAIASDPAKQNPQVKLAVFASYADSLRSFVAISGSITRGQDDPVAFAKAVQDSGKFGIDTKTGKPCPNYVGDVAATIRGLHPYIARHSAR